MDWWRTSFAELNAAHWTRRRSISAIGFGLAGCTTLHAPEATLAVPPDIVVAGDGSGQFTSVQRALQSIPRDNRERRIVFVKDGVYRERVRVDAAYVTLRGESRHGTHIEFAHPASAPIDANGGRAVLDIGPTAHDFVLEHLTVENTHGVLGEHAFAVLGRADRSIIQDADMLSQGNDTLALWRGVPTSGEAMLSTGPGASPLAAHGGRYYHARLRVCGSVDFVCPRGWCYMADSVLLQLNPLATASVWHDGRIDPDKKFVICRTRIDGPPGWYLARRHHDGRFVLIGCSFSERMRDQPPYRVTYPLAGGTPSQADIDAQQRYALTNQFGDRNQFHDCHRDGGDFAWHRDNLSQAPGAPRPEHITARWAFGGLWDPERTDAPAVTAVRNSERSIELAFAEPVSAKGTPRLMADGRAVAVYRSGSGSNTLSFERSSSNGALAQSVDFGEGIILASEATCTPRMAASRLPT